MKEKKKSIQKRDIVELIIILAVFAVIYLTGSQAEVFGKVQQVVLKTGIMNANELDESAQKEADYDFKLLSHDNKIVNGASLKNKTIFMNIWATWCAPCVAEMPGINKLYNKLAENESVIFLMISHDEDFEKAKRWVAQKGFDFPIYRLTSTLPQVYETNVIPTTVVISKEGKVVVKKTGMANYNTRRFRKLLTEE